MNRRLDVGSPATLTGGGCSRRSVAMAAGCGTRARPRMGMRSRRVCACRALSMLARSRSSKGVARGAAASSSRLWRVPPPPSRRLCTFMTFGAPARSELRRQGRRSLSELQARSRPHAVKTRRSASPLMPRGSSWVVARRAPPPTSGCATARRVVGARAPPCGMPRARPRVARRAVNRDAKRRPSRTTEPRVHSECTALCDIVTRTLAAQSSVPVGRIRTALR